MAEKYILYTEYIGTNSRQPMIELIHQIIAVGSDAPYLVSGLAIACALMFFHFTQSQPLTLLFAPVAALAAMVGIFVSREIGLYFSADENSNVIAGGILGVFVGVTLVVIAARIGYILVNVFRRRQTDRLHSKRS